VGVWVTTPRCARHDAASTFQLCAAAATSMLRAAAPARRIGSYRNFTDDDAPVIWKPTSGLAYSLSSGGACSMLDLVEPDLELLRQEHGERRVCALAHFGLPDDHGTRPSRPMRMNAFGAKAGGAVAAAVAAPARSPTRQPSMSPPPVAVSTTTKSRRETVCVVMVGLPSLPADCGTDARVRPAAADVARHRPVDIGVAGWAFFLSSAVADMICPDWQ